MSKKINSISPSSGFTLLETLVVIVAIGILAAIAAPSWLAFIEARRLSTGQDQVYQAMRQAQSQAKKEKIAWQASFREQNGIVQWATHPVTTNPDDAQWNNLDKNIKLDAESTARLISGVRTVRFDFQGNAIPPLGRITLSSQQVGKLKRCVFISTILGAMRTGKERDSPENGKYCY
jgi:prepilin-type N-terminal cleavage/methylation domain-containing protein